MPPRGTRRGAGAKAAAAVAEGNDNEKENVGAAVEAKGPDVSLADELEEMTKKLNMISLEKEKALMLVKEREAQLEQKNAEELRLQGLLSAKEQEQKKLADKVRKLQKMKEFHPTIVRRLSIISLLVVVSNWACCNICITSQSNRLTLVPIFSDRRFPSAPEPQARRPRRREKPRRTKLKGR